MAWYYLFPLFILVLVAQGYKKPWVGVAIIVLFTFFSMFRGDDVGNDTMNNMNENSLMYRASLDLSDIDDDSLGRSAELFYLLLVRFVVNNGFPPRAIIYLFSLVTFLFLFLAFKRYHVNVGLACLFYFLSNHYLFSFSGARQMAAISILLFASSFLFEEGKKKYLFFVWTLVATLMHLSSIAFIIVYPLRYLKINKTAALLFLSVVFLFFSFIPFDMGSLLSRFGMFDFSDRYASEADYAGEGLSIFGLTFKALLFALSMFVFMTRNKETKTDLSDNLFLFSVFVTCVLSLASMATNRARYIFTIYQCVYYADYFIRNNQFRRGNARVAYMGLFVLNYIQIMLWLPALQSPYYMNFHLN